MSQLESRFDDMNAQVTARSELCQANWYRTNTVRCTDTELVLLTVNEMSSRIDALETSIQGTCTTAGAYCETRNTDCW